MTKGRRQLFRIALCLVLGVVTTVGVAWGFSGLYPNPDLPDPLSASVTAWHDGRNLHWASMTRRVGAAETSYLWYFENKRSISTWLQDSEDIGFRLCAPIDIPLWSAARPAHVRHPYHGEGLLGSRDVVLIDVARGWPVLALSGRYAFSDQGLSVLYGLETTTPAGRRVLPVRPLWLGFAIDALVYGVLMFLASLGIGSLRRATRCIRGLCPKCAHDLRGNPEGVTGCGECGWGR